MKYKKIFTTSLLLTPLITTFTTISCNKNNSFIEMLVPFSTSDEKFEKLQEIVDKYNEKLISENSKNMQIKVASIQSRQQLFQNITIGLLNKDPKISDLLFYYPSLANIISSYNRAIDFTNEAKNSNIFPSFLEINKYLGVPKNIKNLVLPVATSSDSLIINKPLLGHLIKTLELYAKANIDPTFSLLANDINNTKILKEIITYYNDAQNVSMEKKKYFETKWNIDFSKINKVLLATMKNKLSDDIFFNYADLFSFSNNLAKIIDNKSLQSPHTLLFSAHPTNLLYSQLFNEANANFKNYFLKYKEKQIYKLDYQKALSDVNSMEYQQFNKIFDLQKDLLNNKSMHYRDIENKNIYNMQDIPFALASTQSYQYIFSHLDKELFTNKDFLFMQAPLKNEKIQTNSSFIGQGYSLMAISHNKERTRQVKEFVSWLYSKANAQDWNLKDAANVDAMKKSLTPIEYFAYQANYLFPSTNFVENYKKYVSNKNLANNAYAQTLLESQANNTFKVFQEPVDRQSDSFRSYLEYIALAFLQNDRNHEFDFKWYTKKIKELF